MSMAIGYGLSEEEKFDEKTGRVLNNNLLDYKLSTFMDHPTLEGEFVENASPPVPTAPRRWASRPPAPALRPSATPLLQATGVYIDRCPITPHVLYEEFRAAGLIED
jgi:xanthine dehydrogenase molybdenum-binding subunit